jgi:hypothetical protein
MHHVYPSHCCLFTCRLLDHYTSPLNSLCKQAEKLLSQVRKLSWARKRLELDNQTNDLVLAQKRERLLIHSAIERQSLQLPIAPEILETITRQKEETSDLALALRRQAQIAKLDARKAAERLRATQSKWSAFFAAEERELAALVATLSTRVLDVDYLESLFNEDSVARFEADLIELAARPVEVDKVNRSIRPRASVFAGRKGSDSEGSGEDASRVGFLAIVALRKKKLKEASNAGEAVTSKRSSLTKEEMEKYVAERRLREEATRLAKQERERRMEERLTVGREFFHEAGSINALQGPAPEVRATRTSAQRTGGPIPVTRYRQEKDKEAAERLAAFEEEQARVAQEAAYAKRVADARAEAAEKAVRDAEAREKEEARRIAARAEAIKAQAAKGEATAEQERKAILTQYRQQLRDSEKRTAAEELRLRARIARSEALQLEMQQAIKREAEEKAFAEAEAKRLEAEEQAREEEEEEQRLLIMWEEEKAERLQKQKKQAAEAKAIQLAYEEEMRSEAARKAAMPKIYEKSTFSHMKRESAHVTYLVDEKAYLRMSEVQQTKKEEVAKAELRIELKLEEVQEKRAKAEALRGNQARVLGLMRDSKHERAKEIQQKLLVESQRDQMYKETLLRLDEDIAEARKLHQRIEDQRTRMEVSISTQVRKVNEKIIALQAQGEEKKARADAEALTAWIKETQSAQKVRESKAQSQLDNLIRNQERITRQRVDRRESDVAAIVAKLKVGGELKVLLNSVVLPAISLKDVNAENNFALIDEHLLPMREFVN